MSEYLSLKKKNLRPHVKVHRATPEIARKQIAAGAIGFTCAKLSEAVSLASSGFADILIANQIVTPEKINRLVNLAEHCDIKVAVDSYDNVAALSSAAALNNVTIGVLVEVNIGHNRCGVAPYEQTLKLAQAVCSSRGLALKGLMGYDGHCTMKISESEREALSIKANSLLVETAKYLAHAGMEVPIVSGSGTLTYRFASELEGITEIQAGNYALMDTAVRDHGVHEFQCALTVLSTVISRPSYPGATGLTIVDTGVKSISDALGAPEVKDPSGGQVIALNDEHGHIRFQGGTVPPNVGDKIELWVRDVNGTINLYDRFHVIRDDIVEAVWKIPLCGVHT